LFYGNRLRQARELRGLTQSGLAKLISKSQGTVANLEAGLLTPSQEVLFEIAKHTSFPASFFSIEGQLEFPTESVMCRARAAATRRDLVSACRFAEVVYEIVSCVLERYTEPLPVAIQKSSISPLVAAQKARKLAGLSPDQPIPHVINAIEKTGIVVLALPIQPEKIDAFSVWVGREAKRPIIALCAGRPGDRLRWNVSHERGHLELHADIKQLRVQDHREADQFAAEFLLPEIAMRQELVQPVTLSILAALKVRWGVSMQALIMRAFDLNIINQWQKQRLFEQIGARGWRMREPANLDIPIEKPRALRQMAEIVYGKPINYARLAAESQLTVEMVRQVVEGYEEAPVPPVIEKSGKVIQMRM
jgi:Zn-dependent peptidase ImmA (M78 family)/transcriptional regulator with XRE-family HTH domain